MAKFKIAKSELIPILKSLNPAVVYYDKEWLSTYTIWFMGDRLTYCRIRHIGELHEILKKIEKMGIITIGVKCI